MSTHHPHSTRISELSQPTTPPTPHPPPSPSPSSPSTTLPPLPQIHQHLASDPWNGDTWCYNQIDAVRLEGELTPQKIQWITQVFEILRLTLGKRAREVEKVAKQLEVEGTMLRGGGLMELEGDREGGEVEGLGRQLAEKAKMAEES